MTGNVIYCLVDPRNDMMRYVGQTTRLGQRQRRYRGEPSPSDRSHCANWRRNLGSAGLIPEFIVLDRSAKSLDELNALEEHYIKLFRDVGTPLTNLDSGGRNNARSEETCAKISSSLLGHAHTDETRAKMSASHTGMKMPPFSDEHLARMRATQQRRGPISDETRAKLSAAHIGRVVSAETRAKLSAAHKGRKFSAETRAKISAAKKGRRMSDAAKSLLRGRTVSSETRAKISAVNKGKKLSTEHRAKISVSLLRHWALLRDKE